MKETGIIMSGDHPHLVRDKIKTMTRRTYGLKKVNENPNDWDFMHVAVNHEYGFRNKNTGDIVAIKCPYGQVGDRLWVRATWSKNFKGQMLFKYQYDYLTKMFDLDDRPDWLPKFPPWPKLLWKPAIHLLKADAEIWLEITEIRVERVQEITEEDAKLEGFIADPLPTIKKCLCDSMGRRHICKFIDLWDSLNAKRGYGWDFNPWVWPISFKIDEERSRIS